MTGKQRCVLGSRSPASVMVALDALVVSTALSTIRLHDLSRPAPSISVRIDRSSESTR